MAFAPVIKPTHPDVPLADGVPPVLRALQGVPRASLLAGSAFSLLNLLAGPRWGVFSQSGAPLLIGDSVIGAALRKDYRVADFPMEQGAFASYNKVEMPFDARLLFSIGGSDAARASFMATVSQLAASLTLVSVVMPEFTYPSANVVSYNFERQSRNGVTLLSVEVWLRQIRIASTTTFTQTRDPSGNTPINGGVVQPVPPTSQQATSAEAVA